MSNWKKLERAAIGKPFRPRRIPADKRNKDTGQTSVERKQRSMMRKFRKYIGVCGVYLIHLDRPLGHAKHYLGMSTDIAERLGRHVRGKGAKFMSAVKKAGIGWDVVRDWRCETVYAAEQLERQLKGNNTRNCTVCTPPGVKP